MRSGLVPHGDEARDGGELRAERRRRKHGRERRRLGDRAGHAIDSLQRTLLHFRESSRVDGIVRRADDALERAALLELRARRAKARERERPRGAQGFRRERNSPKHVQLGLCRIGRLSGAGNTACSRQRERPWPRCG
jgi:hypothetical protein